MPSLTNGSNGCTIGPEPRPAVSAELLNVRAVAALLGDCSTRHVYRLADAGQMPRSIKLGSLVRWRAPSLRLGFAQGAQASNPEGARP